MAADVAARVMAGEHGDFRAQRGRDDRSRANPFARYPYRRTDLSIRSRQTVSR